MQSVGYPAAFRHLLAEFERGHDSERVLFARSDLVDNVVRKAFAEKFRDNITSPYAVVAVGGYGRRELFPYSDIDLLLLLEKEKDVLPIKNSLSSTLQVLWDSELKVSQSVRTVAECSRLEERNFELQISLLDLRFLDGDRSLFDSLVAKLADLHGQESAKLTEQLAESAKARHARFNDTPYHLEPDVKESPGGIRDLHLLRWLAQLSPEEEFLRQSLNLLDSPTEALTNRSSGDSPKGFLFQLRTFLHLRYGRDTNLLTFELQDDCSRSLPPEPIAPEEWMRLYFQHARRIFQSTQGALEWVDGTKKSSLIKSLLTRKSKGGGEFQVTRERVSISGWESGTISSERILKLFAFIGRLGYPLSWEAQRTLRGEIAIREAFEQEAQDWKSWLDLLSGRHAGLALSQMHETGILAAAFPVWCEIDSLVVRDFYHRYTVDEHTVVAIRAIDSLLQGSSEPFRRFRQLALEEDNIGVLRLALLLHDIGKGTTPGEHVNGSLEAARRILQILKAPEEAREIVLFLIKHHLDLSLVMNGRDLNDASTGRFLTSHIETQENLRRLTLFTFADISAVNPTAMTPWRTEQLWRVYMLGVEQLTRELDSERIHRANLFAPGLNASPELHAFLAGLPKRYIKTHSPEQIRHHWKMAEASRHDGVAVDIQQEAGAYLITVLAHDKPGLFASLSGVLASFGMNIVKGEAYSNTAGYIVDLIRFTDPLRRLELNPEEIVDLRKTVEKVALGSLEARELLNRRRLGPRRIHDHSVKTSIRFDNHASDYATLLEYSAEDRPGLLYQLGSTIATFGCNIELVLINTESFRASDVFYLTKSSQKLSVEDMGNLRSALEELE
ncbi:MAG: HD domain-containing protein [Bryobacteraceae bacterium]